MRKLLVMFVGVLLSLSIGIEGASAEPLHGYCANGCIDNGTNSPSNGQPSNFGFTISSGPTSGSAFLIDILVPNSVSAPSSFSITGTLSGTANLFSATAWTSGFLDTYLGIAASPSNPIGAYLPFSQIVQPSATGFNVFQANLGAATLQSPSNPNVSPLLNITQNLPFGSYIVGFLNTGTAGAPNWSATANSGAIAVPEPTSLLLLGSGLAGISLWRRRNQK